ncbi:rhomboid family intramembrane serine protease [Alsobacter sp. R-9]
MFIPLRDQVPLRSLAAPHVTRVILGVTVLVWAITASGIVPGGIETAAVIGGVIPAVLFGHAVLPAGYDLLPPWLTLVTSLLLHGGFLHLLGNMLFLQVFGDNVEDSMGHVRFVVFYVTCGVVAGLVHAAMAPGSEQPLIGASGAVAGVVGAYLVLHPHAHVWGLVLNVIPLRIRAAWALGLWFAVQVYHVAAGDEPSTAWWAHVGGFVAGALLVLVLRRPASPWGPARG